MNELAAERLASMVASEWATTVAKTGDGLGEPRVGAHWPLGSSAPVQRDPYDRLTFVAAKALGTSLLFCFTLDKNASRQYLLCFDLATWPELDLRACSNSVFEAVLRLVGSSDWHVTQQGVLTVSPSLTIVLPGK
jgi:hypothetical protein